MDENIDYLKEVTDRIKISKLLSQIPEENRKTAIELINKKEEIKKKNSLFAQIQINRIDKKILGFLLKFSSIYNISTSHNCFSLVFYLSTNFTYF